MFLPPTSLLVVRIATLSAAQGLEVKEAECGIRQWECAAREYHVAEMLKAKKPRSRQRTATKTKSLMLQGVPETAPTLREVGLVIDPQVSWAVGPASSIRLEIVPPLHVTAVQSACWNWDLHGWGAPSRHEQSLVEGRARLFCDWGPALKASFLVFPKQFWLPQYRPCRAWIAQSH